MLYINILAEVASNLSESAAQSGPEDWHTFAYSAATAIVTVIGSLLVSRKKQRTDDFSAFMKESSDYREEIRHELERKEDEYKNEIEKHRTLIAEKEKMLERLRKENEEYLVHYKFLADYMPQIVWTASPSGDIDYCNQRWFDYTGINVDQARGDGWVKAVYPDDVPKITSEWRNSISKGLPFDTVTRFKKVSDGEYRWFLIRVLPRFDSQGRIVQWIGTSTDINEVYSQKANEHKTV